MTPIFWICASIAAFSLAGLLAMALCRAAAAGDRQLAHLESLPSPRPPLDPMRDTLPIPVVREWGAR